MPFAAVSVKWPCGRLGSRGQTGIGIVYFAWLVGGIRGDCREAPKNLHESETVPPKQFDPGDDDRGAPDHRVERLEGLLLRVGRRKARSIRNSRSAFMAP